MWNRVGFYSEVGVWGGVSVRGRGDVGRVSC